MCGRLEWDSWLRAFGMALSVWRLIKQHQIDTAWQKLFFIALKELLQYSSTLGMPDSVYAWFNIVSDTCHPVPCYLNSDKVFRLLSDQYPNPEQGFKLGSLSECLLEFDTCSKLLGHHSRLQSSLKTPLKQGWFLFPDLFLLVKYCFIIFIH